MQGSLSGRRSSASAGTILCLHLQIGSDTVEVRIGEEGLSFVHPGRPSPEGVLAWEEAVALAMLPKRARRTGARPAA
jgi:hypothetical protein